jgi:peptidyl-prolyl cis-trans isomerase B (cyclophilin B)
MRRALALGLALACAAACGRDESAPGSAEAPSAALAALKDGPHDVAVVRIAEFGEIRFELLPEIAPETVASFESLADQGFFDGTTFHRVIPEFMIQGGCPNTKSPDPRQHGRGGPEYTLPDEFSDWPHLRGTVSMANRGSRNSAGSQFFIVQRDVRQIDGQYTAFGRVTTGMEVVDAIARVEIDKYGRYGPKDRPYPVDVRVESIRIERAGDAAARGRAAGAAS